MISPTQDIPIEELLAHQKWLRGLALGLAREPALADDLLQDTWAVALQHPPRQREGSARAWLGTVLRNTARMRLRGERRRSARETAAELAPNPPASPDALVERARTQRLLVGHVLELTEPLRTVVLLRYFEDLSAAEIARRLDLPTGTVRRRLKDARDKLRSALGESAGGGRSWRAAILPLLPVTSAPAPQAASVGVGVVMKSLLVSAVAGLVAVVGFGVYQLTETKSAPAAEAAPAVRAGSTEPTARPSDRPGDQTTATAESRSRQVRRFADAAARARFAQALQRARNEREVASPPTSGEPPPEPVQVGDAPERDYLNARLEEVRDLIGECYDSALAVNSEIEGWISVWLTISAEPGVGGFLESVDFLPGTTIADPELRECVSETLLSVEFDQPLQATTLETTMTIRFIKGEEAPEAE